MDQLSGTDSSGSEVWWWYPPMGRQAQAIHLIPLRTS